MLLTLLKHKNIKKCYNYTLKKLKKQQNKRLLPKT